MQHLEIRQKNVSMSFQCHTGVLSRRLTQGLFDSLGNVPVFDLLFATDQSSDFVQLHVKLEIFILYSLDGKHKSSKCFYIIALWDTFELFLN
jgi:hypothetical protein